MSYCVAPHRRTCSGCAVESIHLPRLDLRRSVGVPWPRPRWRLSVSRTSGASSPRGSVASPGAAATVSPVRHLFGSLVQDAALACGEGEVDLVP